jgi:alkylation response protein AidB-like acyl-CoA dehydrogenase
MVRLILDGEPHLAGALLANLPGIDLLCPLLVEFGTEPQKARCLPRILGSDDWWCQGFQETGEGPASCSGETAALRPIRSASVAGGSSTAVIRGTRYSALAPEARTIGPQRS